MLSVVVVLALLTTWIVTSGGGSGKKNAGGSNGKNPAPTITPGPSASGPAISQHPGGRDESGHSGGSGAGDGSDSGAGSGDTGSGGSDGASDGGSGSGGGSVGTGDALPASTTLPDCTAGAVTLGLRSLHNSYSPDQTPTFQLTAKNASSADCKVDLGPRNAVLTITPAGDDVFWSSADCPKGPGSLVFRVPAGKGITYTVTWDRKPSAPHCATPSGGAAKTGTTYLLEAKTPGFTKAQASFVLSAD